MQLRFEFKPEDLWVGAFWKRTVEPAVPVTYYDENKKLVVYDHELVWTRKRVDLWVCLVPCLPLHLTWYGGWKFRERVREI